MSGAVHPICYSVWQNTAIRKHNDLFTAVTFQIRLQRNLCETSSFEHKHNGNVQMKMLRSRDECK